MHVNSLNKLFQRLKIQIGTLSVTPEPFLFFGCYWGMLYGFRILRSYANRKYKSQNVELPSPGEIRFLNSGKIRIFAGLDFSGPKPIRIDGTLNSE